MSSRLITTLPISPDLRSKLIQYGYYSLRDLDSTSTKALSEELSISLDDAALILEYRMPPPLVTRDAAEILDAAKRRAKIKTGCNAIDAMLGGGVECGMVTEVCGENGSGKTNFCMNVCANVQALDSEGSFIARRMSQITETLVARVNKRIEEDNLEEPKLSSTEILSNIHVYRASTPAELVALTHLLPTLIASLDAKLIVVDSVAFPFRQNFLDMAHRARIVNGLAQRLASIAGQLDVAVVAVNQMVARNGGGAGGDRGKLMPALGESWGHTCSHRVMLYQKEAARYATLFKSISMPESTVEFRITNDGLVDIK
ncbi:uncharacterized protein VTP21DRAFT_816 [Calcarisporiella thermophila]|uniref:uncharacterized protein n=1 Tax=Calcarisporiella thermophila TaxID=911321 RepID=UPI0037442D1F